MLCVSRIVVQSVPFATFKYLTIVNRDATVQILFGSVLIFDVGFRLFRFGSNNCILFVFHIHNMYS